MAGQWTGNNYVRRETLVARKVTVMSGGRSAVTGQVTIMLGGRSLLAGNVKVISG